MALLLTPHNKIDNGLLPVPNMVVLGNHGNSKICVPDIGGCDGRVGGMRNSKFILEDISGDTTLNST